jgi:hypothetical protein
MERASLEPAIKLLIAEIHTRLSEAARIAKAAEAVSKTAQLVRALRSPWISSSSFMKPGGSMTPHRCSTT